MTAGTLFIGFGEAGQAFASAPGWRGVTRAFDRLSESDTGRETMTARYLAAGVTGSASIASALADGSVSTVISVVTADQATAAARATAAHVAPGMLYLDLNSVAPASKRAAAAAIAAAGGRYVDVAVMAPVHPARLAVPLLLSGSDADDGERALRALGFTEIRVLPGDVGTAASVKLIRSVMVKGIEGLTAELMLAADAAGVTDEVLRSLGEGWVARAAYNLERMRTHGARRAAEMVEAAATLTDLGVDPLMTRATVARQAAMAAASPVGQAA